MKVFLLAVALTTVLFSCQKSKDEPALSQSDYLGKYKISKLVFQSKGNPDQDLLATLPDCAQDDLLVLAADSVFTTEDAGVSCGQSENEPAVWFARGSKMNIDGVESTIVSFDKHTLVLSTQMEFFGMQGTVMETLLKQ